MQKIEFKDYPDTSTLINAENLNTTQDNVEISINEVDTKNINLKNQVVNGWYEIDSNAVPTFTFVSYDNATLTGIVSSDLDLTSYLSVGMKVKFTQNSAIKYAFITAITSTQLTLFLGTDYSLNNSAISNSYYSMLKTPYGFPLNPNKWSVIVTDNINRSKTNATTHTAYNIGNISVNVPIGLWYGNFEVAMSNTGGSIQQNCYVWLTETNLSFNNKNVFKFSTPSGSLCSLTMKSKNVLYEFASKKTLYLNEKTENGGSTIATDNEQSQLKIMFLCAYL